VELSPLPFGDVLFLWFARCPIHSACWIREVNMTARQILFCAIFLIAALPDSSWAMKTHASLGKKANAPLECTAIAMGDIVLMRARFETGHGGLRTFSAGFEAIPGRRFTAGQRMTVTAANVEVGALKLKPIVGGHLAGEMELADDILFGTPVKPFPIDFPELGQDTRVVVTAANDKLLECRLQYRPQPKRR
jgi:hypothetical protein